MMNRTEEPARPDPATGCPVEHHGAQPPAFSVIDVLGGFASLARRPDNLWGAIRARAATCKPFTDGNAAGWQVSLSQPVVISRDPERADVQMTDELYALVSEGYDQRIADLVARGLLIPNGFWHQRLRRGAILREADVTSIWTGLLVRPEPALWLLATGAFNRRVELTVHDTVIASSEGYTPLILEFELASMPKDTMWLESELACLVSLQPGVEIARCGIRERPELGASHNAFYGDGYLERRHEFKSVGRYKKLLAAAGRDLNPAQSAVDVARCEFVHVAGPDVATIETFSRVLGPAGPMPKEAAERLPFVMLRNITPIAFDFDGIQTHVNNEDFDSHRAELIQTWRDLYGEDQIRHVDWWSDYVIVNGQEGLGEPNALVIVYAFIRTPPGWSTLGDGVHYPGIDGPRGVVATDLFHHASPVLVFRRTGDFRLEKGDPLMRLLPVPRHLLSAPYREIVLDKA
jgi:hypothetical protein